MAKKRKGLGKFFQSAGRLIGKGAGALAKGVAGMLFGSEGGDKQTTVNIDVGDIASNLTGKERRQAKKSGVAFAGFMEMMAANWYWFVGGAVGLGLVIWLVVSSGGQKKKVTNVRKKPKPGSSTRGNTGGRTTTGAKSTVKKTSSEGISFSKNQHKGKSRDKWTRADKASWVDMMRLAKLKKARA